MQPKDFQQTVLDTLDVYLEELTKERTRFLVTSEFLRQHPEMDLPAPDFPQKAWGALIKRNLLPPARHLQPYTSRKDGTGASIPAVCLKIPTGGGKTLLAAHSLSRIQGSYIQANHGLVLWIMPNEAIYAQTRRQLTNRQSSIRQVLDRAAAGRVKILEKNDPLHRLDVESNLCVMLLMLQSANRVTRETLRLFRDSGNIHGFLPPSDDVLAHTALAAEVPNLDRYLRVETAETTIKESLGNVLRLLRPVIIMDEGHKGYTVNALDTINDFNPSFILELSATPKPSANWLVDVRGADLQKAQMIRLPINVKVKAGEDWKDCLRESFDKLNDLQATAERLRDSTARYIRPILLVQAERTGKEKRDGTLIHVLDVREYLLSLGLDPAQIAIKTADTNELDTPENADLLSSTCPVRVIVTKQALQEGWDCPFAYVLCTLATNRNLSALTQLVGRILRQPDTQYTPQEFAALNESYVFCHHVATRDVTDQIKKGLEEDGLDDLTGSVVNQSDSTAPPVRRAVQRREKFRGLDIYLPEVNWVEGAMGRPLEYEEDVLSRIDWTQLNLQPLVDRLAYPTGLEASWIARMELSPDDRKSWLTTTRQSVVEHQVFDTVYATRLIADVVPNPWIGRELLGNLLNALQSAGLSEEKIQSMSSFILEELRAWLLKERDRLAEVQFIASVAEERIQFRLRADRSHWTMPDTVPTALPANAIQLPRESGESLEKSLFSPIYKAEFSSQDEQEFACYLDTRAALEWWHRNVAKIGYGVQGWRKNRVYPDFIFGFNWTGKARRIAIWETKGDQLAGNLDSEYKRKLLNLISSAYKEEHIVRAGELALVGQDGLTVECEMILMSDKKAALNELLSTNSVAKANPPK